MEINVLCKISYFRRFMIISTCQSFIPANIEGDEDIFPERPKEEGTMYVEAEDKVTITKIRDIIFMRVTNVLGIIYNSKSGKTRLKWRSLKNGVGRLIGKVTPRSLVNLFAAEVLDESHVKKMTSGKLKSD